MTALAANIVFVCAQQNVTVRLHGMQGRIGGLQQIGEHYRRTGGIGTGAQATGLLATPSTHPVWAACAKQSDAEGLCSDLEALQMFVCRVTDQYGRTLNRVKVRGVTITACQRTKGPTLTGSVLSTYRVEATLELERLPDSTT